MSSKYSVGRLGTRPSDEIMAHTTLRDAIDAIIEVENAIRQNQPYNEGLWKARDILLEMKNDRQAS
jgi:hypothetical protein